jgi:tRNA(Ile)-lysidine synthase
MMKLNLNQFRKEIALFNLPPHAKYLVAVSGGIDSMVLVDLLLEAKIPFSIAHCNFQLRGKDSDEDENFIHRFADQRNIEFFVKQFDVEAFKKSGNYSTQMAARDLRYAWFQELKEEFHFDYLLTAHHLNDSLETFLINLSRGTGIDGLKGITSKNGWVLRPLHSFSKKSIKEYADQNSIKWREDISNSGNDYVRNKIRHQIEPTLKEIHPEFMNNFHETLRILHHQSQMLHRHVEDLKKNLIQQEGNHQYVLIDDLADLNPLRSYLYHLFQPFGFMYPYEIEKLIYSKENGEILSKTHRLIKDRKRFILKEREENEFPHEIEIDQDQILEKPLYLRFSKTEEREVNSTESVDFDTIKFPLKLRKWKAGDYFYPIGMQGGKKLSKYFKDEKFSKLEKEEAWLLVDADDNIVYVMGKRIDDRYKITENTHKFLNIYLC